MLFDHYADSFYEAIGLDREQFEVAIRESERIFQEADRWSVRLENLVGDFPDFPPELAVKLMVMGWIFFTMHPQILLSAMDQSPFKMKVISDDQDLEYL